MVLLLAHPCGLCHLYAESGNAARRVVATVRPHSSIVSDVCPSPSQHHNRLYQTRHDSAIKDLVQETIRWYRTARTRRTCLVLRSREKACGGSPYADSKTLEPKPAAQARPSSPSPRPRNQAHVAYGNACCATHATVLCNVRRLCAIFGWQRKLGYTFHQEEPYSSHVTLANRDGLGLPQRWLGT